MFRIKFYLLVFLLSIGGCSPSIKFYNRQIAPEGFQAKDSELSFLGIYDIGHTQEILKTIDGMGVTECGPKRCLVQLLPGYRRLEVTIRADKERLYKITKIYGSGSNSYSRPAGIKRVRPSGTEVLWVDFKPNHFY